MMCSPLRATVFAVAVALHFPSCMQVAEAGSSCSDNVQPVAYILTIQRQPSFSSFKCKAAIEFKVNDVAEKILLYTHPSLTFLVSDLKVFDENKTQVGPVGLEVGTPTSDTIAKTLTLPNGVQPGSTNWIEIEYSIELDSSEPYGLSATYQPAEFGYSPLVMSVLSQSYAKRLMPCLNDPPCSAKFQLILETQHDETAVSSTDVMQSRQCEESAEPSCQQHTFEWTPMIGPSQLGFVVSHFGRQVSAAGSRFIALYVSRKKLLDKVLQHHTMCFAVELYQACSDLSGVEPDWNIKMVALRNPPFQSADALGLVLFRESTLLLNNDSPSAAESELRWVMSIAQNFARLWFGHVIPNVGNQGQSWQKEGFASYLQYWLAYNVTGNTLFRDLLYTRCIMPAMVLDSFKNYHPIKTRATSSSVAAIHLGDKVTSGKGSAILQTISHILPDAIYKGAIKKYFLTSSEKNALGAALDWAMNKHYDSEDLNLVSSNFPMMSNFIQNWEDTSGYPVVSVDTESPGKVSFSQQQFVLRLNPSEDLTTSERWYLPLVFSYGPEDLQNGETLPVKVWLRHDKVAEVDLPARQSDTWLLANPRRTVFYRVKYTSKNWRLLGEEMHQDSSALDPVSRAMLIDDALTLARVNQVAYEDALYVMDSLRAEQDVIPWEAAREGVDFLRRSLRGSHFSTFYAWFSELLNPAVEMLQFAPTGSDRQRLLRGLVMEMACDLEITTCIEPALIDFHKWLADPYSVPHDTLGAAVCAGMRGPDGAVVDRVLEALDKDDDSVSRAAIIRGLGCVTNTGIRETLLTLTSSEPCRLQNGEAADVFQSLTRFGMDYELPVYYYFRDNFNSILKCSGTNAAISIYFTLCDRGSEEIMHKTLIQVRDEFKVFYDDPSLDSALDVSKDNVQWGTNNLQTVVHVLSKLTHTPGGI